MVITQNLAIIIGFCLAAFVIASIFMVGHHEYIEILMSKRYRKLSNILDSEFKDSGISYSIHQCKILELSEKVYYVAIRFDKVLDYCFVSFVLYENGDIKIDSSVRRLDLELLKSHVETKLS